MMRRGRRPAEFAGAVVNFQARRLRAAVGPLMFGANGQVPPAKFHNVRMGVDGRPVSFVTGRGGEFYVEDLKAGSYKADLSANGTRCRFTREVPDAKTPVTDLGPLVCAWPGEPDGASTSRPR